MKALIIFIKNPIQGKVKTRLAKSVGDEEALQIYQKLILHTRDITSIVNAKKYLYYSQKIELSDSWDKDVFKKHIQKGNDLGEKMSNAFKNVFNKKADRAVIIGSDIPELSADIIEKAFILLDQYDIILGPALDGGYYLLGMKSHHANLFQNLSWSSSKVLDQTLQKIKHNNLSYSLLPTLQDLDTIDDYRALEHYF